MFLPIARSLWYCIVAVVCLKTAYSLTISPAIRYVQYGAMYPNGAPHFTGGGHRYPSGGNYYPPPVGLGGCPVCDSSVYSYCSHKLVHDSCCCGDGYYGGNSFECEFADCNFIHANSCRESRLISDCCCDDLPYRSINSPFSNGFYNK